MNNHTVLMLYAKATAASMEPLCRQAVLQARGQASASHLPLINTLFHLPLINTHCTTHAVALHAGCLRPAATTQVEAPVSGNIRPTRAQMQNITYGRLRTRYTTTRHNPHANLATIVLCSSTMEAKCVTQSTNITSRP
jgi:hypothetical protein